MGPRPDRIVLIGLRRSGKTTVGRLDAAATGWELRDTDELVARTTGRSPADWIRGEGLAAFRRAEAAVVASLAGARGVVVATGGGVPLDETNREILRVSSWVAYLRVDPWILAERASSEPDAAQRPLLAGRDLVEETFVLFAERDALYRRWCDLIVDGSRSPEEVAARIVDASPLDRKNSSGS
jgi:shikimate kinase